MIFTDLSAAQISRSISCCWHTDVDLSGSKFPYVLRKNPTVWLSQMVIFCTCYIFPCSISASQTWRCTERRAALTKLQVLCEVDPGTVKIAAVLICKYSVDCVSLALALSWAWPFHKTFTSCYVCIPGFLVLFAPRFQHCKIQSGPFGNLSCAAQWQSNKANTTT